MKTETNNTTTIEIMNSRYTIPATVKIIDNDNVLNDNVLLKLKQYFASDKATIYFNDLSCSHWMFDFKIDNVWFSSKNINNELTQITLECFN